MFISHISACTPHPVPVCVCVCVCAPRAHAGAGSVAFANVVKSGEPLVSVLMGILFGMGWPNAMVRVFVFVCVCVCGVDERVSKINLLPNTTRGLVQAERVRESEGERKGKRTTYALGLCGAWHSVG